MTAVLVYDVLTTDLVWLQQATDGYSSDESLDPHSLDVTGNRDNGSDRIRLLWRQNILGRLLWTVKPRCLVRQFALRQSPSTTSVQCQQNTVEISTY